MTRSLTYAEMAEALKIRPQSANRLARRKRWPRVKGNDGRTRVAVPEEELVRPADPPVSPTASPPDKLIKALEAHVETLKAQLAVAEARLAATEARAEKLTAELADRDGALASERAKVEAERTKADKAIAEFAALADALTRIAAERVRPRWWRWLAG